jgi:hypothetical protein
MAMKDAQKCDPKAHLDQIIRAEVEVINRRRTALDRERLELHATGANSPILDATGLCLSGGGIRSASFAMGVLQALNEKDCLPRIDYLSTVSGGGYIGSALSATLTKSKGAFVFGETTGKRAQSDLTDVKDTPSVGHVRNYSNYLIPFGMRDVLTGIAIVFRGLVANTSFALPVILLLAAVTILSNPERGDLLTPNFFGYELTWLTVTHFGITLLLSLFAFPLFFGWAVYRSLASQDEQTEFRTWLPTLGAGYLVLVAGSFFCELQPYLVAGMFDLADEANKSTGNDHSLLTAFVTRLTAVVAPIAAVVTVFRQQVATLLKSVTSSSGITTRLTAYAAQAATWVGGAALPLVLWVAYLHLCYWGIINKGVENAGQTRPRSEIQTTVQIKGPGVALRGNLDCLPNALSSLCAAQTTQAVPQTAPAGPGAGAAPAQSTAALKKDEEFDVGGHTPSWLLTVANKVFEIARAIVPMRYLSDRLASRPVTLLYLVSGLLLFVLSWCLMPNANSLHRLYRDRLSKAFLFDPDPQKRGFARGGHAAEGLDFGRDFAPLDTMRISELAPKDTTPYAPYHLINAALNIQGSDFANRRGRNADFFLFSPLFVGSEVTGYASTSAVEDVAGLDLPTAMAISGAAFSSNMGANSIKALTPTLALLNVRTGYWLKNPLGIEQRPAGAEGKEVKKRFDSKFFLWSELSGRLYEDSPDVYLTDGGHIENLGVYQLLRRRSKIIIVVDAEADPAMRMPSFIALQRYARIDLGVRINMPWDDIRKSTMCWMGYGSKADAKGDAQPSCSSGPHAAIGTIDYDGGQKGWLLYIKSSLSGDENDYVRDYARRHADFPHESTGDQFFSEEQFEVYRALGFHIASRLLAGDDELQVHGVDGLARISSTNANVRPMYEALFGPPVQAA